MKLKNGLIAVLALFLGLTTVLAADNTPPALPVPGAPPPAAAPAPALTSAPADTSVATNKPSTKKTAAKKKNAAKKTAVKKKPAEPAAPPLLINEPAVSRQSNVNVRAQAHINSEIITRLKKDEAVTVLEEVTLKHPKTDEPARWARIALPAGTHVWINSIFIAESNQTVKVPKLNIRSGAGENYSVIGLLLKGDVIKPLNTKGDWTEIEAPTNAFGFVAAHLLMHQAATEPVTPPPVVPTETVVQNTVPIAPPPGALPAPAPTPAPVEPPPIVNPVIPAPLPPPADEPPPKRVVQREGIVGGTVSVQAPAHFQLKSLDDGRIIDYLYTTSTNVVLKKYRGRTVLVSGEEELDERWPNTPVITIQKIQVVE